MIDFRLLKMTRFTKRKTNMQNLKLNFLHYKAFIAGNCIEIWSSNH